MEIPNTLVNAWTFLTKFIKSPRTVGSVIPSSRFLVRTMLQPIDWANTRSLVELGAGTGVLTRSIRQLCRSDCQVVVFERDHEMREMLQKEFPEFIIRSNAEDIQHVIRSLDMEPVDCIISSLPFANFPADVRERIIENIYRSLRPGGLFVAYQYSLQMRPLLEKKFELRQVRFVPWNIPCAFVYVCVKGD
jgi:phospholipid N-methyltransferase